MCRRDLSSSVADGVTCVVAADVIVLLRARSGGMVDGRRETTERRREARCRIGVHNHFRYSGHRSHIRRKARHCATHVAHTRWRFQANAAAGCGSDIPVRAARSQKPNEVLGFRWRLCLGSASYWSWDLKLKVEWRKREAASVPRRGLCGVDHFLPSAGARRETYHGRTVPTERPHEGLSANVGWTGPWRRIGTICLPT